MMLTNIGYIRVSTTGQNCSRQLAGIKLDKVFTDECSGSTTDRPALKELMSYVREGDTIHVHSIDRMARNLVDLKRIVDHFLSKEATIIFHRENITFSKNTSNVMGNLIFQVLGAFAEFELSMIHERQAEGIALAKAAGKYRGGVKKLSSTQEKEIRQEKNDGMTITQLAKEYGVTRQTIYRILGEGEL